MAARRALIGAAMLGAAAMGGVGLWLSGEEEPTSQATGALIHTGAGERAAAALSCPHLPPEGQAGARRLALLIGISDYKSPEIPDLSGPTWDLALMHELLTAPQAGYGFPERNVCVLQDSAASLDRVREELTRLGAQASSGDEVLVYFSGHGSQAPDQSGDEPDGLDETWVLHDSRVGGVGDLSDDEVYARLTELHEKTSNITVILDSCSSGSAAKDGLARARLAPQASRPADAAAGGDGARGFTAPLEGLVTLAASPDGAPAFEPSAGRGGFFTQALVEVLGARTAAPLTWAQVAQRLPQPLAQLSDSRQRPVIEGALERYVFDKRARRRPLAWTVTRVDGDQVQLEGPPLPGWDPGAVLRVFPGNALEPEQLSPERALAALSLDAVRPFGAQASVLESSGFERGDLALLALPGQEAQRLPVRVEQAGVLLRALPSEMESRLRGAVSLSSATDVFTAKLGEAGAEVFGPEGQLRVALPGADAAARAATALRNFARHRALLALHGESDGRYVNDDTLALELLPRGRGEICRNSHATVLDGQSWTLRVRNEHPHDTLTVSALLLSSDSAVDVKPGSQGVKLGPGKSYDVSNVDMSYTGGLLEHVLVFGTRAELGMDWRLLRSLPKQLLSAPLAQFLSGFLDGVKGGARRTISKSEWTSSHLGLTVLTADRAEQAGCDGA